MLISLTFHRSILPPVFQSSHQITNACGLEKCVRCQGGTDPSQVKEVWPAQTCWFCRLFTHFQWLIPSGKWGRFHNLVYLTLSITSLTSSPQLYVSFHLPIFSGSTSSAHLSQLCYTLMVSSVSAVPLQGFSTQAHLPTRSEFYWPLVYFHWPGSQKKIISVIC